jgi:biotin transport system substrate-specific component
MIRSLSTKEVSYIALFTALTVVFAIIPPLPVPLVPVPLTLQTLGVMLAGIVLGPRLACIAMALYVLLAAIGLPVLPGARGGLAVFAGPTGGFLLGFIPGAWVAGWMARRSGVSLETEKSTWQLFGTYLTASIAGGALVVYIVGVPWLAAITGMSLSKAILAVAVFMPGDLVKAVIAAYVATRLHQILPQSDKPER